MKRIELKRLKLTNFKGVKSMVVDFNAHTTTIGGANGTGKTTLFDAFTWVLFGKDSQDRKAFDIKTLDTNGRPVPRIPHEVECTLVIDGHEVTLCRRYEEKWTKRRGEAEEQMTGHEETRLYNDVPLSVKQWAEKIDAMCSETVFRYITNPLYFVSQKSETQRAMLMDMAGRVSDEDIARGNADFAQLMDELRGKTLEEYKREIAAKKRRVKTEADGMPVRIDELERMMDTKGEIDVKAAKEKLEKANVALEALTSEQKAITMAEQQTAERRKALAAQIDRLTMQRSNMATAITRQALEQWQAQTTVAMQQEAEARDMEQRAKLMLSVSDKAKARAAYLTGKIEDLRKEWKVINAEALVIDNDQFVCPTCKRPLEIDQIEAKRIEITRNFNANKAALLMDNNERGKALKAEMQQALQEAERAHQDAAESSDKAKAIRDAIHSPSKPDTAAMVSASAEIAEIDHLITEARAEFDTLADTNADKYSPTDEQRALLMLQADEAKRTLAEADNVKQIAQRIEELEQTDATLRKQLAELERAEFTVAAFGKARVAAIESKINALFETVRFKMYREQINGGELETCEAMVGGVPFASLNHARQITAGVEIINAISRHVSISAPIIIDNAEALNTPPQTTAQSVLLYVTDNDRLTVKD